MTAEELATLRRKWSSAKSAVKAAQARLDRADRIRSQNEAATRLSDAQSREDTLRRRVEAAERATAASKKTP